MYRYVMVLGMGYDHPGPYTHLTLESPIVLGLGAQEVKFRDEEYNRNAGSTPDKTDDELVFVHGWRMSPEETRQYGEAMFKRLWHAGYNGHFSVFRWPTYHSSFLTGSRLTFNDSEYRAWKCGEALKSFVGALSGKKHVIAHSMGNIVTGSALQKGMTLDTFVMMQAAVAGNCFGDTPGYMDFLDREDGWRRTPRDMGHLGYGMFLNAAIKRAEKVVNCFNARDYALASGSIVGQDTSWARNGVRQQILTGWTTANRRFRRNFVRQDAPLYFLDM